LGKEVSIEEGAFSKVTAKNNPLMLLAPSEKAERLLKTLILITKNRDRFNPAPGNLYVIYLLVF
jgi:hypothetical protein